MIYWPAFGPPWCRAWWQQVDFVVARFAELVIIRQMWIAEANERLIRKGL